ncbi:MAG: T9SS type A sorting domain-containing protein, partial [Ignavibacteriaceae bacterium]|nr:T9SS type A sorting domain-containing protein [Ignavibacteriaceae bacterium]
IEKVKIMIMANDDYQMYLNGNLIGEDLDGTAGPVGVYDVTNVWNGGVNKIAIKGINTFWSGWVQCLVRIYFGYTTTVINDNSNSNTLQLSQNYPNPFNPSTTIRYSLTSPEKVSIKIYDVSGQLVKEINIEHSQSGEYEVVWDGTNNFNQKVSSGAYFYQISAGEYIEAKKMILLK